MDQSRLWFVLNPANIIADRKLARHLSFEAALAEAIRLSAINPRDAFCVLEAQSIGEVIGGRIKWKGNA